MINLAENGYQITFEGALILALLLVFLTIIAVLIYRSAKQRGNAETRVAELAGRIAQMAEDGRRAQSDLSKAVQDRFDQLGMRMGQSLEQAATKTAKSMGEIETRLKVIDEAQKNITALSGEIVGLQDILSNKQARGAFGEFQLNELVSAILPPNAYEFQATLSSGKRADCLIKLPNPPGPIAVDAKFPLESFYALRAAEDDGAKLVAKRAFANDILTHVRAISEKYIVAGETAESALMFLPSEAVYAELHASFPDVVEKSYRFKVWIVSPTTLMATLNTVRAILKDARMREQAHIIQKEVHMLLTDVDRLSTRVDSLSRHFSQAEEDIRKIQTSSGKISSRAERIEELQLEENVEEKTGDVVHLAPKSGQIGVD